MISTRHGGWVLMAASLAMLAACATPRGAVTSSADLIAHDADLLATNTRADSVEYDTTDYSRDGLTLSAEAHALARTAEDRGTNRQDVANAFDRVARSYDMLRDDANRSGNPNAVSELNVVTQDFLGLEWGLGRPLALDPYAEGERHDRS